MAVEVLRNVRYGDGLGFAKAVEVVLEFPANTTGSLPTVFTVVDNDVKVESKVTATYTPKKSSARLEAEDDFEFDDIQCKVRNVGNGDFQIAAYCPGSVLVGKKTFTYWVHTPAV